MVPFLRLSSRTSPGDVGRLPEPGAPGTPEVGSGDVDGDSLADVFCKASASGSVLVGRHWNVANTLNAKELPVELANGFCAWDKLVLTDLKEG